MIDQIMPKAPLFSGFEHELANLHPHEVLQIISVQPAAAAESDAGWPLDSFRQVDDA